VDLNYTPPPTLGRFMASDARIRVVRGPVGSGKSTVMVVEMLRRACEQAPGPDGIRRTRGVVVRNTLGQLITTSLETIKTVIPPEIMSYHVGNHTVTIRFNDVHSEWILLPLDTPQNVQRLLSLELTFAWLSELREIPVKILEDVFGRCSRFPSVMHGGPTWYGVFGETNSFSEDDPWYNKLELDKPASWDYFVQPGARDPGAENLANLQPNYYSDLVENNTVEWVEQYVDNKVTPSLSGEAVFRSSFKADFHVAAHPLKAVPHTMAIIGMDFGRSPAMLITQMDPRGRILVLDEAISENMGIEQFCGTVLRPILARPEYHRLPIGVVGDPAGRIRSQIGEESIFDALKRLGLSAQPAQTNSIDPRLRAVEKWFLQQRDGGPAILISPTCVNLIRALRSRYRYAKRKDGQLQPDPVKDHPWSDIADALQYAVLGHSGRITARFMRPRRDLAASPVPSKAGWT
jgi:hypothetical protein